MSATEAAYLAGIFDGEGSIMLTPQGDTIRVKITVANTSQVLMGWLLETTAVGANGSKKPANAKHRECIHYQASGEAAETVLRQIRPYLIIKGEQADICIRAQERMRDPVLKADRTWQMEDLETVRALNKRGPKA